MRKITLCIALIAVLLGCASFVAPRPATDVTGFKSVFGQSGANYLVSVALPIIFKAVGGLQFEDFSGEADVPVVGKVDWTVSDLQLQTLDYSQADISFEGEFSASISGVTVALTANWGYRKVSWPHLYGSGSADVSVTDATIELAMTGVDANGRPQLVVQNVDCSFDNIDVTIHGSFFSWLYDLLIDILKGTIKSHIEDGVEAELTQLINVAADQALSTVNLTVPVGQYTQIDFQLTQNPAFPNDYLAIYMKGQFENITNPGPAPVPAFGLPEEAPDRMIGIYVDQYLFNSGLWLAYSDGEFETSISNANLPANSSIKLTTTFFKDIFPGLYKAYPDADLMINVACYASPSASLVSTGSYIQVLTTIDWQAQQNGNWVEAFDLGMNFTTDLVTSIIPAGPDSSPALAAQIKFANLTLTTISTKVGPIDASLIGQILENLIIDPIVGIANSILEDGIPLPVMDGITFLNPELTEMDGYLYIATDISYSPPDQLVEAVTAVSAKRV